MPTLDTFWDDFALPYPDTMKWSVVTGNPAQLLMQPSPNPTDAYELVFPYNEGGTILQSPVMSALSSNSSVFVCLPYGTGGPDVQFEFIVEDEDGDIRIRFLILDDELRMIYTGNPTETIPYNVNSMKYMRIRSVATPVLTTYWDTSPDGYSWTTRRVLEGYAIPPSCRVELYAASATPGTLRIRGVNVTKKVNRNTYWMDDSFDAHRPVAISSNPFFQTAQWRANTDGASFASPDGIGLPVSMSSSQPWLPTSYTTMSKVMVLNGNVTVTATPGKTPLMQTDIRFRIRHSTVPASGGGPSIRWRITGNTYYSLRMDGTQIVLQKVIGGSATTINTMVAPVYANVWYEFRILSYLQTLVIYRDGVEMLHQSDSSWLYRGDIAFVNQSDYTYIDEVSFRDLTYDPALTSSFSMHAPLKSRANYVPSTNKMQLEYLRLEDDRSKPLILAPSYGAVWIRDLDLGFPAPREVINPRTQRDGTTNYTRFHADKPVALSLFILEDSYATVMQYKDALSYWQLPGRRIRMVYKPAGQPERFMDLYGSDFQSPIQTDYRKHAVLTLQWTCPAGGSYSTAVNKVLLPPDDVTHITNIGSDRAEPVIRIQPLVSASRGWIVNESFENFHPEFQARLGIDSGVATDEFAEFDYNKSTVMANGFSSEPTNLASRMYYRYWFPLEPGVSSLRTYNARAEIQWRHKWLL